MNESEESVLNFATRWLICAGIISLFCVVLYEARQAVQNPNGPHGKRIPEDPPNPDNRVSHLSRVSIVAPENWEQRPDHLCLRIFPRQGLGRLKAGIDIYQCERPDDEDLVGYADVMFQGNQAYEKTQVDRYSTFDDPAYSSYNLYVEREGQWWHISYFIAQEMTVLPDAVRQYINSIRFHSEASD